MYNEVHCLRCGETCTADVMAFDFDQIMKNALSMGMRKMQAESEMSAFSEVDLGLYFTYYILMSRFHVTEEASDVSVCASDILWYLEEYRGVSLRKTDAGEELDKNWRQSSEYEAMCRNFLGLKGNRELRSAELEQGIWDILSFLFQKRNEKRPLFHVRVKVNLLEDEYSQRYPSGITVTYDNGHRVFTENMICPSCGEKLHAKAGSCREYIIGMLGSARVGKTAYLAALINELRPPMGKSSMDKIRLLVNQDAGYKKFESTILASYRAGEKIEKTPVRDELIPIFTVQMEIEKKKALFTFVDMPGEALVPPTGEEHDISFILEKRPILRHTDVFWMCVAPAQIDMRIPAGEEPVEDIDEVLSRIKPVLMGLNQGKKLKAALMITMSDYIPKGEELFDPKKEWNRRLYWDSVYHWEAFANFSSRVKGYLDSDEVKDFEADIHDMFTDFNYFAVAAYGKKITKDDVSGVGNMPSHVLDPFIWTLAVLGLIDLQRQETRKEKIFGIFPSEKQITEYIPVAESALYWRRD